jgi:hypothetical protein
MSDTEIPQPTKSKTNVGRPRGVGLPKKPKLATGRGSKIANITPAQKRLILLREEAKKHREALAELREKLRPIRKKAAKKEAAARKLETVLTAKHPSTTVVLDSDIKELPKEIVENLHKDANIIFQPNPGPQTEFLAATEKEVFYGGARGGGKSYSLIIDPLRYCNYSNHRALILRRTMPELRDLINHSLKLYDKCFPGAKFRQQEKEWSFPSGARIEFGYAETSVDALRYHGQAYTWIGIDELPHFPTDEVWNLLKGSLRSVDSRIPTYMRATGNPGNIGSLWVYNTFIAPAPPNTRFEVPVDPNDPNSSTITRRFIPAKLADNPYLTQTSDYLNMLKSLPEIKRKQWLEGDWTAFEGSAFPEFNLDVHVCEPFPIPNNWIKYRAADWGYSTPFCVLWIAADYNNNLYVYREFYGKGLTADVFAQKVRFMEQMDNVQFGIMDSSVWSRRGDSGPSIIEVMRQNGVLWRPSDRSPNSRYAGKMEVHRRLALVTNEVGQEQPRLKIFKTCRNLIQTLPLLPTDPNDPEDVDTKSNFDHCYDALRYGVMARMIDPVRRDNLYRQYQQEQWRPASKVGY